MRVEALDRQALDIVQAIRDVATELDRRREALRKGGDDRQLRAAALVDIDRLSNLVALATTLRLDALHADTRRTLDTTLDELRHRVSRLGTALTISRVRNLRRVAEVASRRHEIPVGKSFVLRRLFVRYVGYLIGLAEGLTPEHEADVREAAAAINVLILADRQRGVLGSFADDPDLAPIDVTDLTFTALDDDPLAIEQVA